MKEASYILQNKPSNKSFIIIYKERIGVFVVLKSLHKDDFICKKKLKIYSILYAMLTICFSKYSFIIPQDLLHLQKTFPQNEVQKM